jgi:hypothetical protein
VSTPPLNPIGVITSAADDAGAVTDAPGAGDGAGADGGAAPETWADAAEDSANSAAARTRTAGMAGLA